MLVLSLPSLFYLSLFALSASSLTISEIGEISKIPNENKRNGIFLFLQQNPSAAFYNGKIHFSNEYANEVPPIEVTSLEEYKRQKVEMELTSERIIHFAKSRNYWGVEFRIAQELELSTIADATKRDKIRFLLDYGREQVFDNEVIYCHAGFSTQNPYIAELIREGQQQVHLQEEKLNMVAMNLIEKYRKKGYSSLLSAAGKLEEEYIKQLKKNRKNK